jgi:hypothetical protein
MAREGGRAAIRRAAVLASFSGRIAAALDRACPGSVEWRALPEEEPHRDRAVA